MNKNVVNSLLAFTGALLLIPAVLPQIALAQTTDSTEPPPPVDQPQNRDALSVIQGKIVSIDGNTLTVRTPDIRPICRRQACPQYIIAGVTFTVDISSAVFESADGRSVSSELTVGESVVVAGIASPNLSPFSTRVLRARVIEPDVD